MIRPAIYISETKDNDLYGLFNQLGANSFRKVAKLCLRGLFDKQSAEKAKELAKKVAPASQGAYEKTNGLIKIRIMISGCNDTYIEDVFMSLNPKCSESSFIKTVVRQVLGPEVLLRYFLKDGNSNSYFIESAYVPINLMNVNVVEAKENTGSVVRQRRSKTRLEEQPTQVVEKQEISPSVVSQVKEEVSTPVTQQLSNSPSVDVNNSFDNSEGSSSDDDFDILDMLEAML